MTFYRAIDAYIDDMWAQGRIRSKRTETGYRAVLVLHADDVSNRDPATTDRDDVKRTLRRWPKPNTQRVRRSTLVSFYDWMMEEGLRPDNPARQTRRPKREPTAVYRLTRDEVVAMLLAARPGHEHRAIYIGICAGLRNSELRGLRGRHFGRPGFVWVSKDIAKGGRQRWVPIIGDLEPTCEAIRAEVESDEFVLPAMRWRNPPFNTERLELKHRAMSSQALRTLVMEVAKRAGVQAHIHPHLMRHAFGDHIARFAGIRNAQAVLGHATVATTETYVGQPTLDELSAALAGFGFVLSRPTDPGSTRMANRAEQAGAEGASAPNSCSEGAETSDEAPTGFEPVSALREATAEQFIFDSETLRNAVALYVGHFVEQEMHR